MINNYLGKVKKVGYLKAYGERRMDLEITNILLLILRLDMINFSHQSSIKQPKLKLPMN
ncbi:hypothetical protein ERIN107935_05760 [Erysipelothrix inopinata]